MAVSLPLISLRQGSNPTKEAVAPIYNFPARSLAGKRISVLIIPPEEDSVKQYEEMHRSVVDCDEVVGLILSQDVSPDRVHGVLSLLGRIAKSVDLYTFGEGSDPVCRALDQRPLEFSEEDSPPPPLIRNWYIQASSLPPFCAVRSCAAAYLFHQQPFPWARLPSKLQLVQVPNSTIPITQLVDRHTMLDCPPSREAAEIRLSREMEFEVLVPRQPPRSIFLSLFHLLGGG